MWKIPIPEKEEAHQASASLSIVRCTRCDNLFFTLKGMSWYTLTIRFLKIYGCGCPLNLNNMYFFPSEVYLTYQDLQHASHLLLIWPNQ